eukprot:g29131.t1
MGIAPKTKRTVLAVTRVDDYALAAPSEDYSNWFWGHLRERQGTIKVCKPIKVLLGREVWQYIDNEGAFHTHVTVREYIMDLIRKYPRTDGKPWTLVSVPWLASTGAPSRSSEFERYSPMKIYGDLGWTRCVLWEIVAPLSRLAELQSKPAEFDYAGAEQLFCYIIGQAEQGLHYTSNGNRNLLCWLDSSFAMESERRSRSGGMVLLANGVIDSDSCKLRQIATSTNEAESRGLFRCMQRVIGIANLLKQIPVDPSNELLRGFMTETPIIYVDNAATVLGANNRIFTRRQRHLEVQMAFINEAVKEGKVRDMSTDDANNMADLNTKPLGKQPFERKKDRVRKGTFIINLDNLK